MSEASQTSEAPILLQVSRTGKPKKFDSIDDVLTWLRAEYQFWKWLESYNSQPANDLKAHYSQWFSTLINLTNEGRQAGGGTLYQQKLRGLQTQFQNLYGGGLLLASSSATAKFVDKLREVNPVEAAGALAYFCRSDVNLPQSLGTIGLAKAALFDAGVKNSTGSAHAELEQLYRDWDHDLKNLFDAEEDAHTTLQAAARKQFDDANDQFLELNEKAEELLKTQRQEFDTLVEKSETRLKTLEKLYEQELALRGPSRYWKKKAKGHMGRAVVAALVAGIFAVAFAIYFLKQVTSILNPEVSAPALIAGGHDVGYVQIVALVTLAFLGIWGLRVLVRLLLSQIHLATDANERSTMVTTYLALYRKGDITETERVLMLQNIFRPSATGVVSDDAAPPHWTDLVVAKAIGKEKS